MADPNDPTRAIPVSSPFGNRPVIHEAAPQPAPRNPEQVTNDRLDSELKRWQIQKMREEQDDRRKKQLQAQEATRQLVPQITNIIDKAYEAKQKSHGWFATGFGADLANNIGGTDAADVKALVDTISANTAFETLQKMRESSPTGGALGAISERELDLLRSTIASPSQSQSDEQFRKSMQDIANAYGQVLIKLPGGRQIMQQRGWIGGKPKQQRRPRVIDFNALPE
jgi:hypothetical protein